jgi:hypothetical protein
MKKNCEKCKKEFESKEDWQKTCLTCFKANKQAIEAATNAPGTWAPTDKDVRILRQVLMKIASEQVKGTPEQLVAYAKKLEQEWQKW